LFPRLEILSTAIIQDPDEGPQDCSDESHQHRHLEIMLFRAVTLNDLQSVALHLRGSPSATCVCFFGARLVTSLDYGCVKICHIVSLEVCPGAGVLSPVRGNELRTPGKGMRFDMTSTVKLAIQEPVDDKLAHSTLSLVLDLARVAQLSGQWKYDAL
jgi:hypothetical protein